MNYKSIYYIYIHTYIHTCSNLRIMKPNNIFNEFELGAKGGHSEPAPHQWCTIHWMSTINSVVDEPELS